jgi:hypothetical protein
MLLRIPSKIPASIEDKKEYKSLSKSHMDPVKEWRYSYLLI